MINFRKRIAAAVLACCTAGSLCTGLPHAHSVSKLTAQAAGTYQVEALNRGISAVSTGSGMLVSWRFLANDPDQTVFRLYRDNQLIYTSEQNMATCYLDAGGSAASAYRVDAVVDGKVVNSSTCTMQSGAAYFDLPLDQPTSSGCTYSPNDCAVGDVDGDGEYELFVKWDPSNSQDNSKAGKTDKVYIDCYKLNGKKLWRIDLGYNIRAGAHYTQMLVADFDLDGKAELTCKTADGTKDGTGKVIGDGSKTYRNSKGYILDGPEYYTLFDGATGAALDTVNYNPPRGTVSGWGDKYGNRCDRYLGAVAYLDGERPSAITVRGYYTRMTACAYDVVNKKLVQRWFFDSGNSSSSPGYGDGNHNCMPADVDNDGKQELVLGSTCLDDDGSVLWCLNRGHGDAMHLGDFLPERKGLELWICHEDKPYGVSLVDASNGKIIFHKDGDGDTGRCCADNVWAGNDGAEFWGLNNDIYDGSGNTLSCRRPAINFLSYWDGDLEREILDGYTDSPATISKMQENGTLKTLLSTDGYYTCNTTKGTPCLSADLFGDWREELIVRAADGKSVRIYSTTYDTDYRITTLMHDPQYRNQVAGQNIAYNQPPHASFYLGSDQPLPARPNVSVLGGSVQPVTPEKQGDTMDTSNKYMFRNVGSGLYLEVADGAAENGTNVQQGAAEESTANTWKLVDAGNGYYYVRSCVGDGKTYYLDLAYGNPEDGANIGIWSDTKSDAQLFKFVKNADGSYTITTKATKDASCLGVSGNSTELGANVLQWSCNETDSQKWIAEKITIKDGMELDESKCYMFKNVGSGKYLEVDGGKKENGANVQQWGANGPAAHNVWHVKKINWGYYYIYSALGDGQTFLLNVDGSGTDGTNVNIQEKNGYSSQYFKLVDLEDGSIAIVTRASKDLSAVAVASDSTDSGANILQWSFSGADSQKWILEEVDYTLPVVTTTPVTTTTAAPTTTETTVTTAATTAGTVPPASVTTTVTHATEQPATTTNTTISSSALFGDVNLDGTVSLSDLITFQKYWRGAIAFNAQQDINANCDATDAALDQQDVMALLEFLIGRISGLPKQ